MNPVVHSRLRVAQMLREPVKEKVERVTNAFLKMKKFDIKELSIQGDNKRTTSLKVKEKTL